jgi:type IV pilus assembly protein PilY1
LPGDAADEDNGPDYNTSFDLTNSWNAFTTTNSRLTKEKLGVFEDTEKEKLINFVHGLDAYDDNGNTIFEQEKRSWILGSFIHSRPYIIHYKNRTVIYAGSNDGMLHAFNDYPVGGSGDGEELWAFIPPSLLGRVKELHTNNPGMFVDGSPKAYVTYDADGNVTKAILIFGLRRGGDYYYALDVTDPLVPKYLWRIYKNKNSDFRELAQTWSAPIIGKVPYGDQTSNPPGHKWVVIFGAGYDTNQDYINPSPNDSTGRGIYMADLFTGAAVWRQSYQWGLTNMSHSIPSDVTKLDMEGDGMIDRLYVGDMKARMWRCDIGDLNHNGNSDPNEWTTRIIFGSNQGASDKRKIFYPPDVTLEYGYEMLFFGTGDREDPKASKVPPDINRIYGLKDKNSMSIVTESNLEDVTDDILQSGTSAAMTVQEQLNAKPGWYIIVTKQEGEACLATPVVFYRTVYFTTFAPTVGDTADPCFVGEGVAYLYAVDYMNGNAVFNFDLTNDVGGTVLAKNDRNLQIGTAIPSGVVITVVGNTAVGYAGVGGGVFRPQMKKTKVFYPLHWKIVF